MVIEARQREPVTPEDSYFRQKEGAALGKTRMLHTMQMLHHHEPHTLVVILFSTRDSVPRGAYFVVHGRPCSAPYPCTQSHMYMYTLGDCFTSGPRAFLSLGSCGSHSSACAHTCMQFMQYMYMHRTQKIAGSSPARGSSSFSLGKKKVVFGCRCLHLPCLYN